MHRIAIFGFAIVWVIISSCSFTNTINNGESAYELKQYSVAIDLLQDEFVQTNIQSIRATKAYLIAKSYQKINNDNQALEWFKKAVEYNYESVAIRDLALSYKKLEMYDEAIATLRKWERDGGPIPEIRREISICEQAKEWLAMSDIDNFRVEMVDLNTPTADYAAVLYENDYLVFTSDREISTGEGTYFWTGNRYSDLFIVRKDGSGTSLFDETINTENNEGAACFNQNYSEMFFTRCVSNSGDDYCRILYSQKRGGNWTFPVEPFYMEENVNYGQPTLVENDSVLIFSTDHPQGTGGYDLYYSIRLEEGWSEHFPMPESINTLGDEKFPVGDGDTLYFSSDYLPGLGGLDIFKTYLMEGGQWSTPVNLKAPINSGADDFSYVIDRSQIRGNIKKSGYFSSSREGIGNDDIYRFIEYYSDSDRKISEPDVVETKPIKDYDVHLAVRVVENILENEDDPNSNMIGKEPIQNANVEISSENLSSAYKTNAEGRVTLQIEEREVYQIKAGKEEFLNNRVDLSTMGLDPETLSGDTTINVEIALDKIYLDKEIIMENIYYDYDEWFIREDARPSLNELSDLLTDNPGIRIQLSSHTDCRGEDDYNIDLSQKRAQAAINYIISRGINNSRLVPVGYGESRLAVDCICEECSEVEHQTNRRTTFKILE